MNPSDITPLDDNFDPLSMNNSFEVSKFEPEPTFEKTIDDIKDNHLKSIASAATISLAITLFDNNFDPLCMKNSFGAETSKQKPTLEKTVNDIKSNNLKSITSIEINVSAITSKNPTRIMNI